MSEIEFDGYLVQIDDIKLGSEKYAGSDTMKSGIKFVIPKFIPPATRVHDSYSTSFNENNQLKSSTSTGPLGNVISSGINSFTSKKGIGRYFVEDEELDNIWNSFDNYRPRNSENSTTEKYSKGGNVDHSGFDEITTKSEIPNTGLFQSSKRKVREDWMNQETSDLQSDENEHRQSTTSSSLGDRNSTAKCSKLSSLTFPSNKDSIKSDRLASNNLSPSSSVYFYAPLHSRKAGIITKHIVKLSSSYHFDCPTISILIPTNTFFCSI